MKQKQVIGILAHVDAGKTTLSEALLYTSGGIRRFGRVDHQDAFLDNFAMERERGITIFSKQAELSFGDVRVTLLDTPGHVDFSAEMERTLQVLDYAILVINGADGVQAHTGTLWRLLKQYRIPVFLFVNKMDQPSADKEQLMENLKTQLDEGCMDFTNIRLTDESLAMGSEEMMEAYLETGDIPEDAVRRAIRKRYIFPCYFGSALKLTGIEVLMEGMARYMECPVYGAEFGAKVYKISRDEQGNRMTHLKITGGSLKVKAVLKHHSGKEEKVNQIRIYSGAGYQTVPEVAAGEICAITGLEESYSGEGFGIEHDSELPILEPVLSYRLILPKDCNVHEAWSQLKQLEEEDPLLKLAWHEVTGEIHIQVMGEVELEVLKSLIAERFGYDVAFGEGSLVYKETIATKVEGVGHFEPLRHYAEVHLLMEPGESGSGIQVEADCSEDVLARNWQRLVLTHIEERKHPGVLTGSEITDMKITLIAGRAHTKHTEGGDFRQATYRAIRQGLKKAESVLLEPYYEYQLTVPTENAGRAISDIQRMSGTFEVSGQGEAETLLTGMLPVAEVSGYQAEVRAYTKGYGRFVCTLKGYYPCHNQEEIVQKIGYDAEADVENPTGSVFCAHGAGFIVPWNEVESYMHVETQVESPAEMHGSLDKARSGDRVSVSKVIAEEDELEAIFRRTYGGSIRKPYENRYETQDEDRYYTADSADSGTGNAGGKETWNKYADTAGKKPRESYLLVDGYNIIFAWEELNELSKTDLAAARGKLMDILCNYQGYRKMKLILVFDGYKVPGNPGEMIEYHNIHVVYTKEAQTADQYIEKLVHDMGRNYDITVATSDGLEQLIIWGAGARRLSARELKEEVERADEELRERYLERQSSEKNYAFRKILQDK